MRKLGAVPVTKRTNLRVAAPSENSPIRVLITRVGLHLLRPASAHAVLSGGSGLRFAFDAPACASKLGHPTPGAEDALNQPGNVVVEIELPPMETRPGAFDGNIFQLSRRRVCEALEVLARDVKGVAVIERDDETVVHSVIPDRYRARHVHRLSDCDRSVDLIVDTIGDELLVYDTSNNRAHSLNKNAAAVWKACDGTRTAEDM